MPNQVQPLSLLVLSDIHFGKSSISPDFALRDDPPSDGVVHAVSMKKSLIDVTNKEHVDAMIVTGDLTSEAEPSEFKECYSTILEIASSLGIDQGNTFFSFGNHDVNWKISKLSRNSTNKSVLKDKLYLDVAASIGDIY